MAEYNNTEQAILDAAEEIFLEKGYNGASTVKIADKAGVTHAMLHYYFRTKEQIFLKILDKEVDAMFSSIRSIMSPEADFWETLKNAVTLHFDFFKSHRRLPFLILNVADNNPDMLDRYKKRVFQAMTVEFQRHIERLKRGIEKGEINDIDPLQLLCTMVSSNISSFIALPFVRNVMKLDDMQVEEFLERRKEEIIRMLYMRLYAKSGEQKCL